LGSVRRVRVGQGGMGLGCGACRWLFLGCGGVMVRVGVVSTGGFRLVG
jgi:hypothetical protein